MLSEYVEFTRDLNKHKIEEINLELVGQQWKFDQRTLIFCIPILSQISRKNSTRTKKGDRLRFKWIGFSSNTNQERL